MNSVLRLSVVIPVLNEVENLRALVEEVQDALDGMSYELILVDDGSQDGSFELMEELAGDDQQIKLIRFRRNFGQTAAMSAGFDVATGEVIVPMDADLQNDPRDIPRLLEKIESGFDVVSGWRRDRKDTFLSRRLPSILANLLISRMTGVHLRDYGCTLKAYRRDVLQGVNLYGELHRFVPALASLVGATVTELPVNHRARRFGTSKYGIGRTSRVILDLILVKFLLSYGTRPMQLFGKWGLRTFGLSLGFGFMTLYMKFFSDLSINRNPLFMLTVFLLYIGVLLLVLGLLAEIVTRTYYESQGKTTYTVRETRNLH